MSIRIICLFAVLTLPVSVPLLWTINSVRQTWRHTNSDTFFPPEYAALVPWSYIFLSLYGITAILVKSNFLLGSFLGLDLLFGLLLFSVDFIGSIFVPLFTVISAILTAAYLFIQQKIKLGGHLMTYGPNKSILSPASTSTSGQ